MENIWKFVAENYQWLITVTIAIITIFVGVKYRKNNNQEIKNKSKGIQAGGDINIKIKNE